MKKKNNKPARIGILGGTFDPVHNGHLILANEAKLALALDKVIFVPAYLPVHKKRKIISAEHRLNMLKTALKKNKDFEICHYEIKQACKCYTVDTLTYLKNKMPNARLFFIVGADWADNLDTWKDIKTVFKLAEFIVALRPNFKYKSRYKRIKFIKVAALNTSSTQIRKRIKTSKSIKYLVPNEVEKYIIKSGLYR